MKILFLLIFLLHPLSARDNPFEPLFSTPKITHDIIPLLHISTNKVFDTATKPPISKQSIPIEIKPLALTKTPEPSPSIRIEEKSERKQKKKVAIRKRKYKTIYQNYFLKVQTNYKNFKIFTNDKLLKKVRYTNPTRITFDFDRLQYFHTKNITLNRPFSKKIKLGSHHNFYRVTVELNRYKHYNLIKKTYGYLLSFY